MPPRPKAATEHIKQTDEDQIKNISKLSGLPRWIRPIMSPIPAKVVAFEQRGIQYQLVVEIVPKYRGSFKTLIFGEIKPHTGSLRDGRLDLVYHQNPGLHIGDWFPLWTLRPWGLRIAYGNGLVKVCCESGY